jgi:hypothetical protein
MMASHADEIIVAWHGAGPRILFIDRYAVSVIEKCEGYEQEVI